MRDAQTLLDQTVDQRTRCIVLRARHGHLGSLQPLEQLIAPSLLHGEVRLHRTLHLDRLIIDRDVHLLVSLHADDACEAHREEAATGTDVGHG